MRGGSEEVKAGVTSWGDDYPAGAPTPAGVQAAAEQVVRTRLDAFDTHRWMVFHLPGKRWVCTTCWRSIEATHGRPCAPIETQVF